MDQEGSLLGRGALLTFPENDADRLALLSGRG
jgi:hypothetical protein